MADPLIQIVDENDNPAGEASRAEAQEKGLFHRIARVLVFDENGRILLQKRASNLGTWPNCWDNSAAGHVDAGESYEEAAHRELNEELGVDGDLEPIVKYKTQGKLGDRILNRFNSVFRVQMPSSTKFVLQIEEVSEVQWFTVDEMQAMVTSSPETVTDGVMQTLKYIISK